MSREQQDHAIATFRASEGIMTEAEEAQLHRDIRKADEAYAGVIQAEAKIVEQANAINARFGAKQKAIPFVSTPASIAERLNRGKLATLYLTDRQCHACGFQITSITDATLMPTGYGDQLVHAPGTCGLDETVPNRHVTGQPEMIAAGVIHGHAKVAA